MAKQPVTLEALIKKFVMKFKKGATDLNDETMAIIFASELAARINRWRRERKIEERDEKSKRSGR